MLPGRHTDVRLTRDELEEKIRPALRETVVALRRAIDVSGVAVEDVSAVLLVGGSSRIPLVGQMVGADLGRPIAVDARPKDAIPIGAALTLAAPAPAPVAEPAPAPTPAPTPVGQVPVSEPAPPPPSAPVPGPRGRSGGRWRYVAAGAAGLVIIAVAAALLADGGDPGGSSEGTTTTTKSEAAASSESTATTAGIDLGDLATGSGEVGEALPGDDWSDEARADFVGQCTGNQIGQNLQLTGTEPETGCGCIYDQVSGQVGFAEFNETWTAPDADTSAPAFQALTNATLSCTVG
jgi:hypothetical protein